MCFLKSGRRVSRVWRTVCNSAALLSCCLALHAADPRGDSGASIPREGLALWLTAGDTLIEDGTVKAIKDRSGNHNDAVRETDPKIVPNNPTVLKHETCGQPVLRFNGSFTGYEVNAIRNIRTVFMVVSKHPDAFKKFAERFVLGGKEKPNVDFHVGAHWTDTIIELGMFKHGKVWFNGFPCDPALSEFAPRLAVISFAAGQDVLAEQVARDRAFTDRSRFGDIGEIIIYGSVLSDADRQTVESYLLKKYAITPFQPVIVPRESVLPGTHQAFGRRGAGEEIVQHARPISHKTCQMGLAA